MRGFLPLLLLLAGVSSALPPKRVWDLEFPPDNSVLSPITATDPPRQRTCVKDRWGRSPLCFYGNEKKGLRAAFQSLPSLAVANCAELDEDKLPSPKQEQNEEIPSESGVVGSFEDGEEPKVMITGESS